MTTHTTIPTPIGALRIVGDTDGLRAVAFVDDVDDTADATDPPDALDDAVRRAAEQLTEYFAGTRTSFDVPLASDIGTEFQRRAWAALRTIPHGRTMSYREQAEQMGSPTAVRAVGAANGRNPLAVVVPCHRVVGADGSLTGYAGGIERKRWLLEHEQRHGSTDAAVPT